MLRKRSSLVLVVVCCSSLAVGCARPKENVSAENLPVKAPSPAAPAVPESEKEPTVVLPVAAISDPALAPPAAAAPAPVEFSFPEDEGGRLLSRLLSPVKGLPRDLATQPSPRKRPRAIEKPSLPLPPQVMSLPRLAPERSRKDPLPQLLTPEPLLGGTHLHGTLPQEPSFPASDRVRVLTVDTEQPPPLAPLATPLSDRALLTDPAQKASANATLAAPLPPRNTPAPFLRLTLPDPFEHRETIRLRTPLPAETVPASSGSRAP